MGPQKGMWLAAIQPVSAFVSTCSALAMYSDSAISGFTMTIVAISFLSFMYAYTLCVISDPGVLLQNQNHDKLHPKAKELEERWKEEFQK